MAGAAEVSDVIVIGAGIAGASVAAELAIGGHKVIVLEREDQPGYHTTGRSAAMFIPTYGPPGVRCLTIAGRDWFEGIRRNGLSETEVLKPCGVLWLAVPGDEERIAGMRKDAAAASVDLQPLTPKEAVGIVPILREDGLASALLETYAPSLDVAAILQARLRQIRRAGSRIELKAEVVALSTRNGIWTVRTGDGRLLEAPVVVNASGAWCDVIGRMAGAQPMGLQPMRRTIVTVDPPAGMDTSRWPLTGDLQHTYYFKAEAGQLWVSPADETPAPPQDIQPEELDVAIAIDRFMSTTTMNVRQKGRSWAGLRCFVPDHELVIGFAPDREGFFWLAGQGGYGIQTSVAASMLAASLIEKRPPPPALVEAGVDPKATSPARLVRA